MRRKSVTIRTMLEPLGVMPSCSRPAVSNDPFSGVLFKTLKYLATHIVPARIFGWTSHTQLKITYLFLTLVNGCKRVFYWVLSLWACG